MCFLSLVPKILQLVQPLLLTLTQQQRLIQSLCKFPIKFFAVKSTKNKQNNLYLMIHSLPFFKIICNYSQVHQHFDRHTTKFGQNLLNLSLGMKLFFFHLIVQLHNHLSIKKEKKLNNVLNVTFKNLTDSIRCIIT